MSALPAGFELESPSPHSTWADRGAIRISPTSASGPELPAGFEIEGEQQARTPYDDMRAHAENETYANPVAALTSYAANAMQAIPFADEAGSAIAATLGAGEGDGWKQRYDNMQESQQALREAGQKNNPDATTMGQVSAGLAASGALPALNFGKGATAVGTALRDIAAGGTTGAGYGLAYGAGDGDAFQNDGDGSEKRMDNAVNMTAIGGALGTAIPVIGHAVPLVAKLAGLLERGTKAIVGAEVQPEEIAAKQLANMFNRDNLDVSNIPVNQNILQAGGRATAARAESIATRGNPASDKIVNFAEQRKTDLPGELSDFLGKNVQETNYPAMLDAIKTKAYADAGPGYEKAYANATNISDDQINQNLSRIVSAGDWPVLTSEARKLAAYDGYTLGNIDATGTIRSFSTKDLDYMTRSLRNLGQATEGMGAMGGRTPIGAMRQNAAQEIRQRLGEINPDFANVTRQYADDVGIYKAAEAGKSSNLFGSNAKQAVYDYQNMTSDVAKQAWRLGQAENLQNMIARNPQAALRQFNTPQFKNVMRNFYSDKEYDALISGLSQRAGESAKLQQVTGNSRTAARQIQQQDDAAIMQNSDVSEAASDIMRSGIKHTILNRAIGAIERKLTSSPSTDKIMANILLSSPYRLAAGEASGQMPKEILAQLLRSPATGRGPTNAKAAALAALLKPQGYRVGQPMNAVPLIAGGSNN